MKYFGRILLEHPHVILQNYNNSRIGRSIGAQKNFKCFIIITKNKEFPFKLLRDH